MVVTKITLGEPHPIRIMKSNKQSYAFLTNIEMMQKTKETLICGHYIDTPYNSENFIGCDCLLLEYSISNELPNTKIIDELNKIALFIFTRVENSIYKYFVLTRIKFMQSFKQFKYFSFKLREHYSLSNVHWQFKFNGREHVINPISNYSLLQSLYLEEV